jgi:hypothetical protein
MTSEIVRKAVSKITWLRNRDWKQADFHELECNWDFVHIPTLFRLHRAWDPFLCAWPSKVALAASDAWRALYFTGQGGIPSDVLPSEYYFLTEFAATPEDKISGDFQHDKLRELPDNPNVRRPNGIALAGQLAKIVAYRGQALGSQIPYALQTAYLYEVPLDSKRHVITQRWLVRKRGDEIFISVISQEERKQIERRLRIGIGLHPSPVAPLPIKRPEQMPSCQNEYIAATHVPELQTHPIETLVYIIALGFTSDEKLKRFREAIARNGVAVTLQHVACEPSNYDPEVKILEGRHSFCCLPELLGHIQKHAEWLTRIAGTYDLQKGVLSLLDELLEIGTQPPSHKLIYDSLKMAFRCDDKATNGMLTRHNLMAF